ncbi:MAG: P-II family nitrogen regulator, partial [Gammaproteobacteria bacterium]
AGAVIEAVFAAGDRNSLVINARGTLMRDRWYQALLPVISPEKEFLQFLVPDREVTHIIEAIVTAGELHLPGSGAVFAVPCLQLACSEDFALWSNASWESDPLDLSRNLRENLTAIYCIVQPDQTDQVARAAMNAGAHGPVVYYCEGRGLRDRLGWLRITKKTVKEMLLVIVDNADAVVVTEAMIDAGDIDMPGRGFLFRVPIQTGLVNIGSTFGNQRYAANMQQIIAAIDEIKGSAQWRDQRVNQLIGTGKSAGLNLFGKVRERCYLSGQCLLSTIVGRKHAELVVDAALAGGAPGANFSFAKLIEADNQAGPRGVRLNRERAIVRVILPETRLTSVVLAIEAACADHAIGEVCLYSQPVTRAITYVPEPENGTAHATLRSPRRSPRA